MMHAEELAPFAILCSKLLDMGDHGLCGDQWQAGHHIYKMVVKQCNTVGLWVFIMQCEHWMEGHNVFIAMLENKRVF